MSRSVFLSAGTLVTPIGVGLDAHEKALEKGVSGIKQYPEIGFHQEDLFLSKIEFIDQDRYNELLKSALNDFLSLDFSVEVLRGKTKVIVSSTKGNIDALPFDTFESTRQILQDIFGAQIEIEIVSNACISGVIAINDAANYIKHNQFDYVVVIGIDVISNFVLYGFQSLFAVSDQPVRPFDKDRKGITLGEGCGIVVLSSTGLDTNSVAYLAGSSSNDANHISGPSRTGEGLYRVVERVLRSAEISADEVDYISAHGTGTLYNDEMESIAFKRCVLECKPINSYKGFFGHTLGAAGVIETICSMLSMKKQMLYRNLGFGEQGTSEKLAIIEQNTPCDIDVVLKTASGFGGGNAALLFKRIV
ncbi:MAG TPA: beta-ketoacyl synthase N-terminal-like domain-containing protein [Taishania sp.]|nr:beta-ketoacyl synthase N-terminal-like domain-containing protein [Taishania sp.]